MTYLKSYIKNLRSKIEESNPSKVTTFETAAQNFAKKILGEFDDFRFFQGESMDPEAMVLLLKQKEDGNYLMYYWSDGLKKNKF